jgi:hypothetical protein
MKKISILFLCIAFILTGSFWISVPVYEEVYLYDPIYTYQLSEGLGGSKSLEVSEASNISLNLEISSDTNFTVLIVYCAFEENEPAVESGIIHLLQGDKGDFNFFVLYVKDTNINSIINSSVAANRIQPINTKHFQFNCSLADGILHVRIEDFALDSGIIFHAELLISYTIYLPKLKTWVWASPIAFTVLVLGIFIPYFVIHSKKKGKAA